MSTRALMTVDEFAQMHTADTVDYELVEGELIPLSSGTPLHARVRRRVERALENFFERNRLGEPLSEIDCRLSTDTIRRPDVSVFLGDRFQQVNMNVIPVPFAPDIAIEILSASESAVDVNRKVREYLSAGSQEVWILDHVNGELFVHSAAGIRLVLAGEVLESALLPGFAVTVGELFAAE